MIRGLLRGNKVYVKFGESEEIDKILKRFGEKRNKYIIFQPLEALYLVDKGKMEVFNKEGKLIIFDNLLDYFSKYDRSIFPKFLIYRDLVDRGYKVTKGYSDHIDLLVYEKGKYLDKPAKIRVIGIDEGKPIKISRLIDEVKRSLLSKKDLKIAVIERRGEIVYYSLSLFKGENIAED